jgi:head-tail adaptor
MLKPIGGKEQKFMNGRDFAIRSHVLFCKLITVDETNRVTIGSRVFDIVGIKNPNTIGHHLEISLLERL